MVLNDTNIDLVTITTKKTVLMSNIELCADDPNDHRCWFVLISLSFPMF